MSILPDTPEEIDREHNKIVAARSFPVYRITHCYKCKRPLDGLLQDTCSVCKWIKCSSCRACDCNRGT